MVLKKKIISVICLSTCLLTSSLPAFADTLQEVNGKENLALVYMYNSMERMAKIKSGICDLSISSGVATVKCFVKGGDSVKSTSISASLQKSSDNGKTWSTIQTWSSAGKESCTLSKTKSVGKGYYRVYSVIKADSESKNIVSSERKY
ncbi:hypothetical protein GSQ54_17325 [Clostridioides difficile]|uniref:hypothetical protein n=1 Tax=unclassified Clostridioides TaxID=2635829 RepID=UPI0016AA9DE5|nr:hypothetical protein [Clostridioides difficile]